MTNPEYECLSCGKQFDSDPPFHDEPERFVQVLTEFLERNEPMEFDPLVWRTLMTEGRRSDDFSGDEETVEAVFDALDDERSAT